jgi:glucose/arabinose dehydrogenase
MKRAATALGLVLAACGQASSAQDAVAVGQSAITGAQTPAAKPFVATPVATFDEPWALTFLPDNRMLVTEKGGALKLVTADGALIVTVGGTPAVASEGQGGMMDVVLHPKFAENQIVYLSWSAAGPGGKGVMLGRGQLVEKQVQCIHAPCPAQATLAGFATIFRATPFVSGNGHFSGRIAFSPDGKYLFFTNGERQKFDPAQDKGATLGKVLRLNDDGTPAANNPLVAEGFRPEVWSYGHRNLLGIAFDAQGRLWEQEMGPRGGDEVNLVQPAKNYGWPIVSNGDHYDGRNIPDHPTRPEFEAPKVSWNPVISPGGLMIYSGKLFPAWTGSAFIGGLSSQALIRVAFDGDKAREAERFDMGTRIREVEQGPDGALNVLEDGTGGRLLKLTPKG